MKQREEIGFSQESDLAEVQSLLEDRRATIIIAVSLALGLGVVFVPELLNHQPPLIKNMFASAMSTGGLIAILLSWPAQLAITRVSRLKRFSHIVRW